MSDFLIVIGIATEKKIVMFWLFRYRYILLGLVSIMIFLSILIFLLKRSEK